MSSSVIAVTVCASRTPGVPPVVLTILIVSPILKNLWKAALVPVTLLDPDTTSTVPVPVTSPDRLAETNDWIPDPVPLILIAVAVLASARVSATLK